MVDAYIAGGLLNLQDTVLDVGTGQGFFPKELTVRAIKVEAIEPYPCAGGEQVFEGTQPVSASKYIEANPESKFSVVHVGNLHPASDVSGEMVMNEMRAFMRDVSNLTSSNGRAIIGISATDPFFVSPTSRFYLRPALEACFEEVTFKPPHMLGQPFSIGGQMGVWECSKPRPSAIEGTVSTTTSSSGKTVKSLREVVSDQS